MWPDTPKALGYQGAKQKFFSAINYKTLEWTWHRCEKFKQVNIFKSKLKLHFRFSPPLNHIYTGYRKASIYYTRLRLGMSPLAAHLFPYGSSDTPYCYCGDRETTHHFPLCCTKDWATGCHTRLDRAKHTPFTLAYAWWKQTDYYFVSILWFSYYTECFYI